MQCPAPPPKDPLVEGNVQVLSNVFGFASHVPVIFSPRLAVAEWVGRSLCDGRDGERETAAA